jgi:hypothetical protein
VRASWGFVARKKILRQTVRINEEMLYMIRIFQGMLLFIRDSS